eukprot:6269800-Pyramimonas_sp.AAC.1
MKRRLLLRADIGRLLRVSWGVLGLGGAVWRPACGFSIGPSTACGPVDRPKDLVVAAWPVL